MLTRFAGIRPVRLLAASVVGLPLALMALSVGAPAARADGPVTVPAPAGGSVSVDATHNLVDQAVHVSWKGFKPSEGFPAGRLRPVRVYECRGAAPAGPQECYGSSVYKFPGQTLVGFVLPDGPANFLDAGTSPDGKGSVDIETRTVLESTTLGCDAGHPCSIVVVPNYGDPTASKIVWPSTATTGTVDLPYSWANHVTVPISFAPSGANCPLGDAGVTTIGSPLSERAVTSWQPAACQGASSVNIDYTSVGESQGRAQFLTGRTDVGLTTLPADAAAAGARAFTYAPIDIGAVTVSFHVDDALTAQPITAMKLNPRLVAKLLTESYGGFGTVAPGDPVGPSGNPATVGNPRSIFDDPEFRALNPGPVWLYGGVNPLVVSGNSDLVWELTRWIASDPAAAGFLAGTADQWKMHVNTHFKGITYPVTSLELRDPDPWYTYNFAPLNGLDLVARSLVADQPSGASVTPDPVTGVHAKVPRQISGLRSLIAITDSASAAAFNFPVAALANAAGKYVTPTPDSLRASAAAMALNPDKVTRRADFTSKDASAYPVTMVSYAMVPTSGTPAAKITNVVRTLNYAIGPGQLPSVGPGGLPAGYLPLTTELIAQTKAAVTAVQTQSGTRPPVPPSPTAPGAPSATGGSGSSAGAGTGSGPGSGAAGSGSGAAGGSTPALGAGKPPAAANTAVAASGGPRSITTTAITSGPPWFVRLALPLLLLLGLAATLAGPVLVAWGRGGRPRLPSLPARLALLRRLAPVRRWRQAR